MRKLYCFDFDGTLTYSDTMFLFLKFYDKKKYFSSFIKHIPLFTLLKLRLVDAEKVKKSFIASVLKGEKKSKLEDAAIQFFEENYPKIIRRNALDFIKSIDPKKTKCYLVTASLDVWVKPFSDKLGMELISTAAEFENGIFTGNFTGKNCNHDEKVCRLQEAIGAQKYDKIIAFGDTKADKPMLKWADESHYKFFH